MVYGSGLYRLACRNIQRISVGCVEKRCEPVTLQITGFVHCKFIDVIVCRTTPMVLLEVTCKYGPFSCGFLGAIHAGVKDYCIFYKLVT